LGYRPPYQIVSELRMTYNPELKGLTLGLLVFKMPLLGSLPLLLGELLLFILAVLSIGIFISTRTSSQQVAMMVSLFALMMPTILLSGFIFPIDSMPVPLQIISNIIPAKFFIK